MKQVNDTAYNVEILVNFLIFKYIIKVKKGSWVGIGYGRSMINCDMNAVNAFTDGTYDVLDLYSFRRTAPPRDINVGGKSDLREINKTDEGNFIRVSYTRLLNTGDQYDAVLTPVNYFIERDYSFDIIYLILFLKVFLFLLK